MESISSRERTWAVFVATLVLFPLISVAQETHQAEWGYSGQKDPKAWANLDPSYATCGTGHAQSPINIRTKHAKSADLPPLQMDYRPVTLNIIDNGHTIEVLYPPGSTLTVGGKVYKLTQFHFHHPSEEHIDGKGFPLSAHLVHSDADGKLAVVAVVFDIGGPNLLLDVLWRNIPAEKGKAVSVTGASINAADLLPANHGYYTFSGSLTTPPCTEGVTWYVLKTHSTISKEQLDTFAKLYKRDARPIQPLNGREILQTK